MSDGKQDFDEVGDQMRKSDALDIMNHVLTKMEDGELEEFYKMIDHVHTMTLEELKRRESLV